MTVKDRRNLIEEARKVLDAEQQNRKFSRVIDAERDVRAAKAVVRQLEKRLQEIASADDDVFE